MNPRSQLQSSPNQPAHLSAKIQQRPWHDPVAEPSQAGEQPKGAIADFSHVDLFSHAPVRAPIQAKLTVGEPNDPYEQEADRVAEHVMTMAPPSAPNLQRQEEGGLKMNSLLQRQEQDDDLPGSPLAGRVTPFAQRQAPEEDAEAVQMKGDDCASEEKTVQRQGVGHPEVGQSLESRLSPTQGGGNPLPDDVRSFMEPRFGADFSQVRVHTDGDAVQMSQDLNAQAFTHKQDVYFGAGKSPANDALTAHELTHVVQQATVPLPLVQRDEQTGGMSTPQGTSASGTAPNASIPTAAQTEARKLIDQALQDFSQSAFRDITDWSIATDAEKLKLIDKATDLGLGWVGPRDEAALERCWASFGTGFEAAVEGSPYLWNRSVKRGVEPEAIPQIKGKYAQFKQDVLATVTDNLYKNEEKVVAEMAQFGIIPSPKLLSPKAASKLMKVDVAPTVGKSSPTERLKEQAQLAKVVQNHKQHLEELKKCHVGIDNRQFDPGNPTESYQDIVLYEGMTSWQWVKSTWDKVTAEIALIFNAWPALYAADTQGTLGSFANQSYDKVADAGGGLPADPLGANDQVQSGLGQVRETLNRVLENIQNVRDKVEGGGADALDFAPVHSAIFSGSAGSRKWSRAIYSPIMSDEREVKDTAAAAAKFAIDAALFVAMIAGVVGTMGGAAIAVGVAAAGALKADTRASELAAARGAAAGQDSELVTKEAVTAADAEAFSKKIELGIVALTSALAIGVEAAAAAKAAKPPTPGGAAAEEGAEGAAGLRSRLNQRQSTPESPTPAAEAAGAAGKTAAAGAMKSWGGIPVGARPNLVAEVVNKRLASDGVPEIGASFVKGKAGFFDAPSWSMKLPEEWFVKDAISEQEFFDMVEVSYHEARHARQWYNAARLKAGEGGFANADDLASHLGIRKDIAQKAWSEPMPSSDPLYAQTQEIYNNVWGANRAQRNQILDEWKASCEDLEAKTDALKALKDKPKTDPAVQRAEAELTTAQQRNDRATQAYQNMPEERDAYTHAPWKRQWAEFGLRNRAAVRAAETKLEAAQTRLKNARQELAKYQEIKASSEAMQEADIARAIAEDDVKRAEAELVRAKNFSAKDAWGP
ncbi:MAG: DUF4157 domain-containing protein [Scytolyngbya sp. HA4215-MV1]|nr:DUF4157 domain-containing protein [Scytolyngbya sp. HA4215-MV1]